MKRTLTLICLCLLPSLAACADRYPPTYSAEAITATVIDAETKKPLPGVIVTANWQLLGGMEGNYPVGQLEVLETVTDANGRFHFPAWGPKQRIKGYLREDDPQLLLFKPGYEYRRLNNYEPRANAVIGRYQNDPVAIEVERQNRGYSPNRRSEWNGKVIELKRFRGAGEGYARLIHNLAVHDLHFAYEGKECEWKKTPRMLTAIHRLNEQLIASGAIRKPENRQIGDPIVRRISDVQNQTQCGSVEEFFRRYFP